MKKGKIFPMYSKPREKNKKYYVDDLFPHGRAKGLAQTPYLYDVDYNLMLNQIVSYGTKHVDENTGQEYYLLPEDLPKIRWDLICKFCGQINLQHMGKGTLSKEPLMDAETYKPFGMED